MAESRRAELATALSEVRAQLERVSVEAGRDCTDVTIIAVTKTWPASDVALLAELGVTDVGENRHQEGRSKQERCPDVSVRWHHIGVVQSNKARAVAQWADVVHGLDRAQLVAPLATARPGIEVLVQVSLDGDPARGGCAPDAVLALARSAVDAGLTVRGVMAVAPIGMDPDLAFSQLADTSLRLQEHLPEAGWISAGMSGDWEHAVKHGATHLRLGSVLMGRRPPLSV